MSESRHIPTGGLRYPDSSRRRQASFSLAALCVLRWPLLKKRVAPFGRGAGVSGVVHHDLDRHSFVLRIGAGENLSDLFRKQKRRRQG